LKQARIKYNHRNRHSSATVVAWGREKKRRECSVNVRRTIGMVDGKFYEQGALAGGGGGGGQVDLYCSRLMKKRLRIFETHAESGKESGELRLFPALSFRLETKRVGPHRRSLSLSIKQVPPNRTLRKEEANGRQLKRGIL